MEGSGAAQLRLPLTPSALACASQPRQLRSGPSHTPALPLTTLGARLRAHTAASEFVECVTDDLLGQSVFVFTPSGEVVRLPKVRLPRAVSKGARVGGIHGSLPACLLCLACAWSHPVHLTPA